MVNIIKKKKKEFLRSKENHKLHVGQRKKKIDKKKINIDIMVAITRICT